MGKSLIVGAVVLTLAQVVIASASSVFDAAMIGGTALLLVVLWDEVVMGEIRRRR